MSFLLRLVVGVAEYHVWVDCFQYMCGELIHIFQGNNLKGCQTLSSEKTERASHFHVCFQSNHNVSTTGRYHVCQPHWWTSVGSFYSIYFVSNISWSFFCLSDYSQSSDLWNLSVPNFEHFISQSSSWGMVQGTVCWAPMHSFLPWEVWVSWRSQTAYAGSPIGGAAVAFAAVALHWGLGSPEKAAQRAPVQQAWWIPRNCLLLWCVNGSGVITLH